MTENEYGSKTVRAILEERPMTTTKHTPGPWTAIKETAQFFAVVEDSNGREICAPCGETREIRAANARLIASAPALVEALQIIEENLPPDRHLLPEALETIRLCRRAAMSALRSAGIED